MAVYTAAADALVVRLLGCAPAGVARTFECASTGEIETTPREIARCVAAFEGTAFERTACEGTACDGSDDSTDPGSGGRLACRAARSPVGGRDAVRALFNGPVVTRVGRRTFCRLPAVLARTEAAADESLPLDTPSVARDPFGADRLADATLVAAHETRDTTALLTDRRLIRRLTDRVVWA